MFIGQARIIMIIEKQKEDNNQNSRIRKKQKKLHFFLKFNK
jgi:hypothetical protein